MNAVQLLVKVPATMKLSPAATASREAPAAAAAPARPAGLLLDVPAKQPAADSGPAADSKLRAAEKARFTKLTEQPVGGAYFDQCVDWALLRDGRELLLCEAELWHFPSSGAPELLLRAENDGWGLASLFGNRFAALPGLDAVLTVHGSRALARDDGEPAETTVRVLSLPDLRELASLALPFDASDKAGYCEARDVRFVCTAPGAGGAMLLTRRWLFFVRVSADASGGLALSLEVAADLTSGPLGLELRLPPSKPDGFSHSRAPELVQCAALWAAPAGNCALLGSNGRVLVVPLFGTAGPLTVLRRLHAHEPAMRSERFARVHSMSVLSQPGSAAARLVTVGGDGCITVSALHDGVAVCVGDGVDESWKATRRGSGQSKQYAYAAATLLCVHRSGVAFASSWSENGGIVFDLDSRKASPAGKTLCQAPKLSTSSKKFNLQLVCMSPSGLIATSNSNYHDDPTLVVLRPTGAAGAGARVAGKKRPAKKQAAAPRRRAAQSEEADASSSGEEVSG